MQAADSMKIGLHPSRLQQGASLIELLIGVAVGLFVAAGALTMFMSAFSSSTQNLGMTHLDQQLRAAMDVMTRNMRRAGYNGATPGTESDLHNYGPSNPFQTNNNQMTLGGTCNTTTNPGECTCITFTYDGNADGAVTTGSGTIDLYGFRYDSANQAIEMRKGTSAPPSCTDAGNLWEDITDPSVAVDSLTFQYERRAGTTATTSKKPLAMNLRVPAQNLTSPPSGCPSDATITNEECLQLRTVIVTIDAHLAADTATTMSIRQRVKIRNDRYCTEGSAGSLGSPPC